MSNLYWTQNQKEFKDILLNYQNVSLNNNGDLVFTNQSMFFNVLETTQAPILAKYGKNRTPECRPNSRMMRTSQANINLWTERCSKLPPERCESRVEWAHNDGRSGGSGGRCKKATPSNNCDGNVYYFLLTQHGGNTKHTLFKESLKNEDFPFFKFLRLTSKN